MDTLRIDADILTTALDAWERDPARYHATPFHVMSLAYPIETAYLWQLSRGAKPPEQLVDEALRHLVEWGLIDPAATLTSLGRRLLESVGTNPTTSSGKPTGSPPRPNSRSAARLAESVEAGRLSDRALHLLSEIGAGRDRIFVMDERPPGWTSLERLGLAARAPRDRAVLTPDGKEFLEGVEAGRGEVRDDGWTRESAEGYLAEIGAPNSVFDAGHQAGVRAAVGLAKKRAAAAPQGSAPTPGSTGRVQGTLTTAKVLADLRKATELPTAILTRRVRRSGLTVRKHSPAVVYVSYVDHGDRGDRSVVWPKVLAALEAAGYRLGMADGSVGAAAHAKALRTGAVLVARPAAGSAAKTRSSAGAKDRTIVIAWTDTEMRYDHEQRATKPTRVAKTAMWLNRGSAADYEKARAYVAGENEKRARSGDRTQGPMRVFVYPTTERDPLGRAKRDVLAES